MVERIISINSSNALKPLQTNPVQSFQANSAENTQTKSDDYNFNINYVKDNKNDIFLRDYVLKRAGKKGLKQPDSVSINVYAPDLEKTPNKGFSEVAFGPYNGFVDDFFKIMSQNKRTFDSTLSGLKGDEALKTKMRGLYNYLGNYYKLQLTLKNSGKSYNLINLSQEDKTDLLNAATEEEKPFIQEVLSHSDELDSLAFKFSRREVKRKTLSIAGADSRDFIKTLVIGTLGLFGLEKFKPSIITALGGASTFWGGKFGIVTEFVGGVGDDVLASVKDYQQDKVAIGQGPAIGVLVSAIALAMGAGYLVLNKFKINTMSGAIGFSIVSSIGSIWSNACAFAVMHKKQPKMIDNGLIQKKDNESKMNKTWKNYLLYDAYFGKVIGILSCIPFAIFAQKMGYLAKVGTNFKKPLVATFWLTLIGSGETIITCLVQALRDKYRKSKIDSTKEAIVAHPEKYEEKIKNPGKFI